MVTLGAAELEFTGASAYEFAHPVALASAGSTIGSSNAAGVTLSGAISGTGALNKAGSGLLVLTGSNGYSGATAINGGIPEIGGQGSLGASAFYTGNISNDGTAATLKFNSTATQTLAGIISGAGLALVKENSGRLTLSGANSYTGATTVDAGTLKLDGSLTSNVTINAAGTLSGTGSIVGNLTVGGTLAPGASPGAMNVTGTVSWLPGGTYNWEVSELAEATAISPNNDLLNITGVLDLAALDPANQFTINVMDAGLNANGAWQNGRLAHSWVVATASGGINWNGDDVFVINTTNIAPLNPATLPSRWFMRVSGNNLILQYVPEPGTLGLLGFGALMLLGRR